MNTTYFGVSYVRVLPPQDLYIPVLPGRYNDKLVFTLCRTCAKECSDGVCTHTERQREILGVYTSPELELAVEKGYKILQIYEVWVFTPLLTLFIKYVQTFLKWKTEASGLPAGITDIDDPEFDTFIEAFFEKEGVRLDKDQIKNNPGLRYIAKLCLNSLWGKMAERAPNIEDIICHSDAEVWELFKQAELEVRNIEVAGTKHIVTVRNTAYADNSSKATNLAVASFTTAHARVKLYRLLEAVGHRVLYCDTDSCVFVAKEGEHVPETGRFLGDLTDEFEAGSTGDSFVCTGPKSYAVRVIKSNGDVSHILKAKGLTLNKTTSGIINFEAMLKIVLDKIDKDSNEEEREWVMGDDQYYEGLKDRDVTAIAIEQMRNPQGEQTLHNVAHNKDVSTDPNVNTTRTYLEYNIHSTTFNADKKGGVSITQGKKKLRMTSTKRALIKNTARTIPFGYRGPLPPL